MNNNIRKKPAWLNKKIHIKKCQDLHGLIKDLKLNTVCQEAMCPNISECATEGVATFLILGRICTRNCRFCAVVKNIPGPIDRDEPFRVAEAVKKMGLKHVVVTSVTRDDIPDGGAGIFADTITAIRKIDETIVTEVLVPDFQGRADSVKAVLAVRPHIFAHNLETVPRLYPLVRQMANYERSLAILKSAKAIDQSVKTKSGLMLGLGETEAEVCEVLEDLIENRCDFLSIGQYLSPSHDHYPIVEYITPDKFEEYRAKALALGFSHVESAPYVRSSYIASRYI